MRPHSLNVLLILLQIFQVSQTAGPRRISPDENDRPPPPVYVPPASGGGGSLANNPKNLPPDDPRSLGLYADQKVTPFTDRYKAWDIFLQKAIELTVVEQHKAQIDSSGGDNNDANDLNKLVSVVTFRYTTTQDAFTLLDKPYQATTSTSTSVFDPTKPTEACKAFASLNAYCSDGGQSCRCYSQTFYVPEQWNSLAAGCVRYACPTTSYAPGSQNAEYCGMSSWAASYTSYCNATSVPSHTLQTGDAAVSTTAPRTTSQIAPTSSSSPTTTSSAIKVTSIAEVKILILAIFFSLLLVHGF